MVSVWFDGTYVHYAYAGVVAADPMLYRRGLTDRTGTITWSAAEQTAVAGVGGVVLYVPFVSVDSNGYVWISYRRGSGYPYVTKSGNNDGTWGATPGGFPHLLINSSQTYWAPSITPLTSGKMFAFYGYEAAVAKGKAWDGAAWKAEIATTSSIALGTYHSAVAKGDNVHVCFQKEATFDIVYVKYTYDTNSFGTEATVQSAVSSTSGPLLSRTTATGNLHCFWVGANHIYYKKYVNGSWDASATDWFIEADTLTANDCLTCFVNRQEWKTGLVYVAKAGSPYDVKFACLSSINDSEFRKVKDAFRRAFRGASFEVTRSALLLGNTRDSVTGWYPKSYAESTAEMIVIQKESQKLALDLGYWVSLDALGLTVDGAEVYDLVTDSFGRVWIVETVKPIIVGDSIHYFVCDLKELSVYGG
jgi:hypothetical protein